MTAAFSTVPRSARLSEPTKTRCEPKLLRQVGAQRLAHEHERDSGVNCGDVSGGDATDIIFSKDRAIEFCHFPILSLSIRPLLTRIRLT